MSFLGPDDGQTLDDALAFIDSFDDVQKAPKTKKKRVRSARSTSTALQRRQKAETLQLREQVAELLEQLKRLRDIQSQNDGHRCSAMTEDEGYAQKITRKIRYDQAMTEYLGRLQAEKDNRKLREMLASQVKASTALRGLLQKQSVTEGLDFVNKRPQVQRPLTDASQCSIQLEKKVEDLYCRISSHTVIRNDEQKGTVIEIVMVTPMACSIKEAGNLVWEYFKEKWDQGSHPNSLEKNYVARATSSIGLLELEKWNYIRKFEESERTVIVWTNLIFQPEHNVKVHLQSSTVVSHSKGGTSVARSFVQLYSEELHEDHENSSTREAILAFAGDASCQHLQSQQNQLLQNVGRMERTLPLLA
ncbi:hypothetical protein PI124_g5251 [Phytophthora idaei]|nr:hypothetical protein PI125_g21682 [Phytophthora idaei]KAG3131415.1 hypothetical protein PI126_g20063 [Phytophthora idaei]KAG3250139.1 hypothetical protein PI124_g5251 [Phytophthora idaei]